MTSKNIASNNTVSTVEENKNAVIFIDKYTTAGLSEIEELCRQNDLHAYCIIYNYTLSDTRPYKEIIKYIANQKQPPVVIIDSNTCLFPQCIMSSAVLGTLEEMKLAKIHTYRKNSDKDAISLSAQGNFDLLTEATWQLKSIEKLCNDRDKRTDNDTIKSNEEL